MLAASKEQTEVEEEEHCANEEGCLLPLITTQVAHDTYPYLLFLLPVLPVIIGVVDAMIQIFLFSLPQSCLNQSPHNNNNNNNDANITYNNILPQPGIRKSKKTAKEEEGRREREEVVVREK